MERLARRISSYEAQVGNYLQHVYGETEYGGTQVLKLSAVPSRRSGMPDLPPILRLAIGNHPAHAVRRPGHAARVLGAMTYVAKRNVKPADDEQDGKGGAR
jgi:hypothetical protein